ncbi:MAG: four helix bundle protein [Desulfobacterales bacterium]|nr:four helix bundle protein [Desulfobacterales bacterium]
MYKFEKLEVWQLSLEYTDMIYSIAAKLPDIEKFNLNSQITRAATSISLNIAEGSTGQSNAEQNRFLGMALRSLVETVACMKLIQRRNYVEKGETQKLYVLSEKLFAKLTAFRKAIRNNGR